MNNLSLTQKLIAGFGVLLIIIVGFGIYSHNAANKQNLATKNVEDWMETAILVSELSNHMDNVNNLIHISASAAGDAKQLAAIQSEIESSKDKVKNGFDEYETSVNEAEYDTEAERQSDLDTVRNEVKLWTAYLTVAEPLQAQIAAGGGEAALSAVEGRLNSAYDAVQAAMEEDRKICEAGTAEAIAESDDAYSSVAMMSTVITLVAAIFCIGTMILLNRNIKSSVNELIRVSTLVSDGDLRSRATITGRDEFAAISEKFNHMIESVRKMCEDIQGTAVRVASASEELTASAHQSSEATQAVAQSVTEVAAAAAMQTQELGEADSKAKNLLEGMQQMSEAVDESMRSVEEAVNKAKEGNELAIDTIREMNGVTDTVLESTERVSQLGERSKEIGQIVSVIAGIAGQTNLLALNAAIEAARAGEQGRGFAVVAEEIRKLAEESSKAAQQISDLIGSIQTETNDAVVAMDRGAKAAESGKMNLATTGDAFNQILERVNYVRDKSAVISDTVKNLMGPIDELAKNIGNVADQAGRVNDESQSVSAASEEQAAGIDEIASSSQMLAGYARDLEDTAMKFKL